jgi:hypothetical protein
MDVKIGNRSQSLGGAAALDLEHCMGAAMPDIIRSCAREALFLKKENGANLKVR